MVGQEEDPVGHGGGQVALADAELAERVDALRVRFDFLSAAIGDEQRGDSLISTRRAIVREQGHAAEVRETSAQRARQLTDDVKVLQNAANTLTAESSKHARRTATATRLAVFLLAAAAVAAGMLGDEWRDPFPVKAILLAT